MNLCRMFFVQSPKPTPSMHQKLTKLGTCCMQNNQLPTKSPIELEDNSRKVCVLHLNSDT